MAPTNGTEVMPMRMMGNTGMQVSVLSFGFWATLGSKEDLKNKEGLEQAKALLRVCRDAGINLFDNAEAYGTPRGAAEELCGQAIVELRKEDPEKWRRTDLVITTKIFWAGTGVNETGLSRKHVIEGMKNSLKRLQCDYVDMVFCHRPDPFTPTETVVRAMSDVIRQGMAMSWGTSEWSAQQFTEAFWIAQTLGLEPPQFEQPQYNMFWRQRCEQEYHPLYRHPYNMGTTIWSPLASGLLTGKYNDGKIPAGSRLTMDAHYIPALKGKLDKWIKDGTIDKMKKLSSYAKEKLNCSVSQLAIAWCVRNANITTTLLGATKPDQLKENLGALAVAKKMTRTHDDEVEAILGNKPEDYGGWGGAGMRQIHRIESEEAPVRVSNYMIPPAKRQRTS